MERSYIRTDEIVQKKAFPLTHDFEREEIEECACAVCGALNPVGISRCLACGESLPEEQTRIRRLAGDKKRAFYVLKEGTYFLGREGEWGEYLEDFGCVSRRHLVFMVDKKQVRCRVLPTTNGTCFAKQGQSSMQRLPADTVITLQPGDCLGLGGDNRQDPNIAFLSYEII